MCGVFVSDDCPISVCVTLAPRQVCGASGPFKRQCVPSCGAPCVTDDDCGTSIASACSACTAGSCSGNAEYGNCSRVEYANASYARAAPVLPSAWNATVTFTNYMTGDVSVGYTWYDYRWQAMRQDFPAPCPFVEAQDDAVNAGRCSVLFNKGQNLYVYPDAQLCCGYFFPLWRPSSYRDANASFGGAVDFAGAPAEWFQFAYTCPWTRPPTNATRNRLPAGVTVQRDVFFLPGTSVPVGMNETLTTSQMVFSGLALGPQDSDVFTSMMQDCVFEGTDAQFLQVCNKYNAQGRLGALGFE
jgi:hypothetical protein